MDSQQSDFDKVKQQLQEIFSHLGLTVSDEQVTVSRLEIFSAHQNFIIEVQNEESLPQKMIFKRFNDGFLCADAFDDTLQKQINDLTSIHRYKQGKHPKVIYSKGMTRLDEMIESRNMNDTDYDDEKAMKQLIENICDMHYDQDLIDKYEMSIGKYIFRNRMNEIRIKIRNIYNQEMIEETAPNENCKEYYKKVLSLCLPFKWDKLMNNLFQGINNSDLVMSHNDFKMSNILKQESGEMTIIDFDGVCFNSRAMDIATLFLGHADRIPSAIQIYLSHHYSAHNPTEQDIQQETALLTKQVNQMTILFEWFIMLIKCCIRNYQCYQSDEDEDYIKIEKIIKQLL